MFRCAQHNNMRYFGLRPQYDKRGRDMARHVHIVMSKCGEESGLNISLLDVYLLFDIA